MADQETETPTVESIAAEYNLGQEEPQAQEQQPIAAQPAPDPVTDPNAFQAWVGQQTQQTAAMQQTLNASMQEINESRQRDAQAQEEQELNALVDKVHGELGDGVSKNLVKYALADRYNSNASFKAILDNRNAAPEAMEKALAAIMPELRGDFSIKADPQIAENQRAMSASTQSSARRDDSNEREQTLLRQPQAEFEASWERIKNGR